MGESDLMGKVQPVFTGPHGLAVANRGDQHGVAARRHVVGRFAISMPDGLLEERLQSLREGPAGLLDLMMQVDIGAGAIMALEGRFAEAFMPPAAIFPDQGLVARLLQGLRRLAVVFPPDEKVDIVRLSKTPSTVNLPRSQGPFDDQRFDPRLLQALERFKSPGEIDLVVPREPIFLKR